MPQSLTPKQIALEWGISPKTLRKFLRGDEKLGSLAPGKGGRWEIPRASLKSLKTRFDAWIEANKADRDETPETPDAPQSPIAVNWDILRKGE